MHTTTRTRGWRRIMRGHKAAYTIGILIAVLALLPVLAAGCSGAGSPDRDPAGTGRLVAGAYDQSRQTAVLSADGAMSYRVAPSDFMSASGKPLLTGDAAYGYADGAIRLGKGDSFEVSIDVRSAGTYALLFDYFILTDGLQATEYRVELKGAGMDAVHQAELAPLWRSVPGAFPTDRYGNEVMPARERAEEWQTLALTDPRSVSIDPLPLKLEQGLLTIRVTVTSGELLGGSLTLAAQSALPAYADYAAEHAGKPVPRRASVIVREAEQPDYLNDSTINPVTSRDLEVRPYETNRLLLNTLGGKTWARSGQTVYYEVDIAEAGLYEIAVRYKQSDKPNARVYRTLYIDGEIPFREVRQYPFEYTNEWRTEVLRGEQGPFLFYLSEGRHRIGLAADAGIHDEVMKLLQSSLAQVNDLNLEIRKLVGNDVDRYRDWEIMDYLPDIQVDLRGIADALDEQYRIMLALNGGVDSARSLTSMELAISGLRRLAAEPNEIPRRLAELSGSSGSVLQYLSLAMQEFEKQPLTLDQIYIAPPGGEYPEYRASWLQAAGESIKRFFHSFVPKKQAIAQEGEGPTLNVWINRARNYLDLLQRMTDEDFTAKTGIRVEFTMMPNEQRLTLAAASGTAPDIALGISNWLPFELGIRGAALDLRQFEDFPETIRPFLPGSFLTMMVNGEVYGIPETQDFYVLFYREDVLGSLGIPVPDTWQEVIEILPELQRYGMNFYAPIAGASGSKPFMVTAPFIYQMGGDLFGADAFDTGIDSRESLAGIGLMTDLFKIYGLPMQVPNFFEHFRSGMLPIGVSNFTTYVQLQVAAPELDGLWKIAPAPGVSDGSETVRWSPGSAQVSMIFKDTEYPEESWEFLKWWLSAETQARFASQLHTLYGKEYLWNTANTDAFRQGFWPDEDKEVVLEQWRWLKEVPKTPSAYMIERELSNIWNKVVFDDENIRSAVEEAVIEIDKETARKMEEFGYMAGGRIVAPYEVPTIEEVEGWVRDRDGY